MLNAESSPPQEGGEGPLHAAPADLMSLARKHFHHRWSAQPSGDSEGGDEYQLRWESHKTQLAAMVAFLENDEASSDMTVTTKGASIPSHRLVLAAASPFFCQVLQGLPTTHHPVIVVKTTHPRHLRYLISFCYSGTITLPSQDVNDVLQLAEELEISGLKITPPEAHSSSSLASLSALHPRLPRPASPTKFPFTAPLQSRPCSSSSDPSPTGRQEESSGTKRTSSPSEPREGQIKKFKVDPLAIEGDGRPHSNPSPYYTPPGSAPPSLSPFTNSLFFKNTPISPPSSAPPQPSSESFSLQHTGHLAEDAKDQDSIGLSVVPASRLLQSSSRSSSRQSSPQPEQLPSCHSPPSSIPQTPTTMTRAPVEPTTPSTPSTPITPKANTEAGSSGSPGGGSGSRVLLWRFLLDLLHNSLYTPMYIRWMDRPNGIFRIMESDMVAQLWGMARKNSNMNYEKMSRGMRTYYKRGILLHIDGTKLIYKFNTSDAEIQQRMRYYDLTKGSANDEETKEPNNTSPSFLTSPSVASGYSMSPATSSSSSSLESIYNPIFQQKLLYDSYFSFLRNSRPELY